MLRAALLAVLFATASLAFVAAPASADPVCPPKLEPSIGQNTWDYACGRLDCIEEGLPNIMVTCL